LTRPICCEEQAVEVAVLEVVVELAWLVVVVVDEVFGTTGTKTTSFMCMGISHM
jgi:hypothetical protein